MSRRSSDVTNDLPDTALALKQLRELIAKPAPPAPKPLPKHLLLCITPLGSSLVLPTEDSGFDLVPATVGCLFLDNQFSLPDGDDDDGRIVSGLHEWEGEYSMLRCLTTSLITLMRGVRNKPARICLTMNLSKLLVVHSHSRV